MQHKLSKIICISPKQMVLQIVCNYSGNGQVIKLITARRHFEREADVLLSLKKRNRRKRVIGDNHVVKLKVNKVF